MTEPFKPVLTITTAGGDVSALMTEQHRWACPCGEQGPWVDSETEAAAGAAHHGLLDFLGAHRGVRVVSITEGP